MASSPGLRLSFLGGARTVTGSRFLLEAGDRHILVDCGLYQERELQARNWQPFPVAPDRLDAVLLTHAHLDHCGLLPRLAREGFRGRIYATGPTAEIARIVMLDSARLQVEDMEQKRRRHERESRTSAHPLVPLYTEKDAEAIAGHFQVVEFGSSVAIAGGVTAEFFEAGHILGSASIRVTTGGGSGSRSILFSGDIGRWGRPIINDPDPCDRADYVLMESTYGDSLHGPDDQIGTTLRRVVSETVRGAATSWSPASPSSAPRRSSTI